LIWFWEWKRNKTKRRENGRSKLENGKREFIAIEDSSLFGKWNELFWLIEFDKNQFVWISFEHFHQRTWIDTLCLISKGSSIDLVHPSVYWLFWK
jgi:hypothetical protein